MSSNLSSFVTRFGLRRGLSLYGRTKWERGSIQVTVPGLTSPLWLRAGSSDRGAFTQIFVHGEYDVPYPGSPRFIIDAGANVGYATVKLASLYPDASIVAIEPGAESMAILERNVAHLPHVTAVRAGVWPRDAVLAIENPDDEPWALRLREVRDGEAGFPAVSIGGLLRDSGRAVIDILKVDIEGTERELFADASCDEWLSRTNMLFVETHDRFRPGCAQSLAAAVARHPFRRQQSGENVVLIREPLL